LWPPQALAYALIEVYRLNGDVLREGAVEEFFLNIGVPKSSILVVHNFEQVVIAWLKRTSDG